ncbi:angiopoietin 4 [Ictidomys tridecemlineatus]|uniref:angiopoietin-4 isoform X2 n=1 Tax=Ictidomys tridecemlineatus TaxID=43179 RepID=UPI00025DCD06|nr:angiopoietin-4 isoform X2 [Ictidomys tridecemlineatus]KAG3263007.1 angiopoietin 4 [Ictidomys tridecemlineatus]
MLSRAAMLLGGLLLAVATMIAAQRSGPEAAAQCQVHLVQSGPCSYTFVLPDPQLCPLGDPGSPDSLQRDVSPTAPSASLGAWRAQRMRQLEKALENSTLRLQKLERYIQMNLRSKLARAQQHMVQNQTAAMLELGSDILNETAARTSDVEAKVLNETSRLEVQMMETSLSTEELEKQLLQHSNELHRLQGRSSALETRLQALETQQQEDLASLREEKEQLRRLLGNHSGALAVLERSLRLASSNSSLLQMQQRQLLESVQRLVHVMAQGPGGSAAAPMRAPEQMFQDCAEIRRSGATADGVYTIRVANDSEPKKVFCGMESNGGGWTIIQRRVDGSEDFQRSWKEYKEGFGNPAGEYWLGNEAIHQLTSRATYSLRVELEDWEDQEAYAQYERFQLGSEAQLYRISVSGYSDSVGRQTGLFLRSANFSTRDADNDNCVCECAQLLSGGWWFDACGLSNLNGVYYRDGQHLRRMDGVRWQYFRGPGYSLRATRMMIRPVGG